MASIFVRTLIIYLFISVALKLMGKRQIEELEISELVSTLLVSEIAALPIADPNIPLLNAVIPVLLIVCLEIIISAAKNKSERLKRYVEGVPTFIIYRGKLRQGALAKNRISLNELMCELRIQGIGDIRDVYYAILEQNGKLSVFENKEKITHSVIIDGETDEKALRSLGYDGIWVKKQLSAHRVRQDEVFLMTVDDGGVTYIIKKEKK